ncbi:MAG: murein biosynthesis integral membrane protein MurJ [Gammaproteobacteria bacterium]|nr:murein biosynthesis integral membrane protein MurJ [Gammaproteobacteria bacterium]
MTLLSRVLGFVRDVVIARAFGASVAADAFFVAFKIPNLFRRLFAEGAFSQAFVPVLAEYREREGEAAVGGLVGAVAGALGVVLLVFTVLGVVAAPALILLFAPGFVDQGDKLELATSLLRVTFPYLGLISLAALAGAVLNTFGRFAVPAFTPVLLNVALIGCAIGLAPQLDEPVMALAIGVVIGGVAQLGLQLVAVVRLGLPIRLQVAFRHPGVRRILVLMGPAIFGVSVAQINLMLDTVIASFLQTGSISWLYYSDRLVEFPLGVFGIALATVILPSLSSSHSAGSRADFSATLDWALRWVFLVGTPAALGLAVLAGPMLSTLFQYGALDLHDVAMSARSLVAYAGGLLGFILVKVLAPGYFARQDTRTPVRIGMIAMGANMVMNLALVFPLAHAGLALATTLSAYLNALLLWRGLRKQGVYLRGPGWPLFALRVTLASATMCLALGWWLEPLALWATWPAATRAAQLAIGIALGGAVYAVVLLGSGLRPRDMVMRESGV